MRKTTARYKKLILLIFGVLILSLGIIFNLTRINTHTREITILFKEPQKGSVRQVIELDGSGKGLAVVTLPQRHRFDRASDVTLISNLSVRNSSGAPMMPLILPFSSKRVVFYVNSDTEDFVTFNYDIFNWGENDNENYYYPYNLATPKTSEEIKVHQKYQYGFVESADCDDCTVDQMEQEVQYVFQNPDPKMLTEVVWNQDFVSVNDTSSRITDMIRVYWLDSIVFLILLILLHRMYVWVKSNFDVTLTKKT